MARSRRTPRVLILPMLPGAFQPLKPAPGVPAKLEGFTAPCGCKRLLYFEGYEDIRTGIAREKHLKGWRREKKANLMRMVNPEIKDPAQKWGWRMIAVHEKMYAADPVLGLRWSKSSEQHG